MLGCRREAREQHRRTEQHRDLCRAQDGNEIRAGPHLLLGQQHHRAARDPGAVHLGDAAVVAQRRHQRRRVHPRRQVEIIGVGQREVYVAGVRALDALGHAGRAAGVEDGRQALPRVVEPRRRVAARLAMAPRTDLRLREGEHVEGRQAAEARDPAGEDADRVCVLEHVRDQGVGQRGVEKHHHPAGLENAEVRGHDLPVVLFHGHGDDLVRAVEPGRHRSRDRLGPRLELGEGERLAGVGNLQRHVAGEPGGRTGEDVAQPPRALLVRNVARVASGEDVGQAVGTGVFALEWALASDPDVPPPGRERENHEDGEERACQDVAGHHAPSIMPQAATRCRGALRARCRSRRGVRARRSRSPRRGRTPPFPSG